MEEHPATGDRPGPAAGLPATHRICRVAVFFREFDVLAAACMNVDPGWISDWCSSRSMACSTSIFLAPTMK
jgi:hypothetical protein